MRKVFFFLFVSIFLNFLVFTNVLAKEVETTCEYYNDVDRNYLGINIYFYDDGTIEGSYYYDGHIKSPAIKVKNFKNSSVILEEYQRSGACPKYAATYQSLNPTQFAAAVEYYLFYNDNDRDLLAAKAGIITTVTWAELKKSSTPSEPDPVPDDYTVLAQTYTKRSDSSKKVTFSIQYNPDNGFYRNGVLSYSDVSISPAMVFKSIRKFQEVILKPARDGQWPMDLYCGTLSPTMGLKSHSVIYHPASRLVQNGDYVCTFDRNLFQGSAYERYSTEGGYLYTPDMSEENPDDNPDDNQDDDPNYPTLDDIQQGICDGDNCDISLSGICEDAKVARTLKFLGIIISLIKIFVPILIIVLGSVDFAKAMIAGKSDEIPKKLPILIKRFIVGVIIFLIPSVIDFLFGVIDTYSETMSRYENCFTCLFNPDDCDINN